MLFLGVHVTRGRSPACGGINSARLVLFRTKAGRTRKHFSTYCSTLGA